MYPDEQYLRKSPAEYIQKFHGFLSSFITISLLLASTMSNHAKERGCAQTSVSHGGFNQPKIAYKRLYCWRLSTLTNCLVDDLVSFPSFRFLKTHKIAFCSRVSAMFCTIREKLC